MSLLSCERCWDNPCTCPGSSSEIAAVASRFGFRGMAGNQSTDAADGLRAALERARVVGVLDAWAVDGRECRAWTSLDGRGVCALFIDGGRAKYFYGETPAAARAAAAKAIEAGEV